jgi:hypothetical protein
MKKVVLLLLAVCNRGEEVETPAGETAVSTNEYGRYPHSEVINRSQSIT